MRATLPCTAFGPFVLDPAERLLLRGGRPVALPPKAFDVLVLLVARAGHLVTKDELIAAAWPGVVVEDNALSVAVSRLRTALGEAGRGCIETVPGHGYRFVAAVTPLAGAEPAAGQPLGADGLDGPPLADVVPTLTYSGDGSQALPAGAAAPPAQTGVAGPARGSLQSRRRGLFLGVGVLIALALAVFAAREERPPRPAPAATAAHTPPVEALLAYRRGRALWESRGLETMTDALAQFKLAVELDPSFAQAHLGQAQVYAIWYRSEAEAEAAVARALALDSTLAAAWATRGFVRAFQAWDWAGAEAAFARARALDADDVTTLQWLASLRMVQRRLPEAEAALRRALALEPDYAPLHADLCEVLYYRRAWTDALAACDRALALDPTNPFPTGHRTWIGLQAPEGRAEALRRLADADRAVFDAFYRARLHARLGHTDSTLAYVERAVTERAFSAPFLHPDPLFDFVRDDPRWTAAMRRMGLAGTQREG